jgi:hypothetical protein
MRFRKVESVSAVGDDVGHYALGIFASGFETRAIHVAKNCSVDAFEKTVAFGFSSDIDALSRRDNDLFFKNFGSGRFLLLGTKDDDQVIFKCLNSLLDEKSSGFVKILVDYSVMTRSWYGAILTWARLADFNGEIEIDFVYASGRYLSEFDPLLISELETLPNFEGNSGGFRKTTALFGLGYDQYATLAVYDRIEPDVLYCCVAGMSAYDASAIKALAENQAMVEASERIVELPLLDVEAAFRLLCDVIVGIGRDSHVVVVPMGPKTHVLVTLLVALRLPWLTCLHAKGVRSHPIQVEALGPISIARVFFSA